MISHRYIMIFIITLLLLFLVFTIMTGDPNIIYSLRRQEPYNKERAIFVSPSAVRIVEPERPLSQRRILPPGNHPNIISK